MKKMMPQLLSVAPDAIYVIVTNPCDVLTVLAQEDNGLPPERLFASGTVLDTSRLRWQLARRAGVSTSSVHAYIVGEHGDTEFPLWSAATIGTVPILEWQTADNPPMTQGELDEIAVDVRDAAYKVIQGKGATNYAIGLSSARIIEAILNDEHAVMPVSPVLRDFHGVDGVALSVPSIVSAAGAVPIREIQFSSFELELFHRSAAALSEVADSLR
jgi:L-lactate dehydrogenase